MKTLISQAKIIDKRHGQNGEIVDILIEDGVIQKIGASISEAADEKIEGDGLCVSIGWMDMRANFRDPGEEYKEGISNGLKVAAKSGFTAVSLSPDTTPAVDNKGAVEYMKNRAKSSGVDIHPIGAVSVGLKGESMSEMYDMHQAGAVGFGDDKHPLNESGLLHRALLYTSNFDAPVLHFPYDSKLIPNGQINEGTLSTSLGLKGIPAISEEMMVRRDLTLLEYTEGRLHLGPISSAISAELADESRQKGLRVTTEVTAAHLAFSEEKLNDFDSNFKLMPPLRTEENRKALIAALKSGKIDVISSDHSPEDEEHKKLEFDLANFGMAGMELFFPMVLSAVGNEIPLDELVEKFSISPREILGIDVPLIAEGEKANLTVFSIDESADPIKLQTKGYNVPQADQNFKGRVIRTFHSN
ncbi:dihydroorotase [Cryomorphaceae bacterium 1068]|nr:dihydroorotase [Cryomorphaceae bacterium 1068]